jgi:hypothetical protein
VNRRRFLQLLTAGTASTAAPGAAAAPARRHRILLQQSPLAGFQYHAGESLWPLLSVGAPLTLAREPDNRHDSSAVAVHFLGRRIGYLPRVENTAVSQLIDRGQTLHVQIAELSQDRNPWKRIQVAVELEA